MVTVLNLLLLKFTNSGMNYHFLIDNINVILENSLKKNILHPVKSMESFIVKRRQVTFLGIFIF